MRADRLARSKSATNSLTPSTWMEATGNGEASTVASGNRLALPVVAREKTRAAIREWSRPWIRIASEVWVGSLASR